MRAPLLPFLLGSLAAFGCSRVPTARVAVRRLEGPRPPQVVARCLVEGLPRPIQYQWKLAPGLHGVGWNPPLNEATVLVQLPTNADSGAVAWAECSATGGDDKAKRVVKATAALVPPRIASAPKSAKPRELVTVRGNGFGPTRGDGDGLYFVSPRGDVHAADGNCAGATWADSAVSACVPASLAPGSRWQLRVQAGDELALTAAPLVVADK
ncbi:MAG TPA: hypothetical protein VIA18_20630 [Polyangia bacterium]|jgi:hypothetical protein|nr:hypothetical protein [Polyangia bacterium]